MDISDALFKRTAKAALWGTPSPIAPDLLTFIGGLWSCFLAYRVCRVAIGAQQIDLPAPLDCATPAGYAAAHLSIPSNFVRTKSDARSLVVRKNLLRFGRSGLSSTDRERIEFPNPPQHTFHSCRHQMPVSIRPVRGVKGVIQEQYGLFRQIPPRR